MSEKIVSIPATEYEIETVEGATDALQEIIDREGNLVELFNATELSAIFTEITDQIGNDKKSMDDYIRKYERAIKLAKMEDDTGDKTFPFDGASRVMASILLESAIEFNSRVTPDILGTNEICKVKIGGTDETEKKDQQVRGERVSTAINTILTQKVCNWRDDTDKATVILPIVGTFFKKTWIDSDSLFHSKLIYADEMIFDHNSDTFDAAPCKTHEFSMTKNMVIGAIRSGVFQNISETDLDSEQTTFEFYESHCLIDLDEDGYSEPYIAVICKTTDRVISISARFTSEDVTKNKEGEVIAIDGEEFFDQTIFVPDPFGSCMGLGWGIILGDTYETINTNLRQMLDAGTLGNTAANTGFIRQGTQLGPRGGNRQRKGEYELILGKFVNLPASGNGPLKDDIAQIPFAGPSQALLSLMTMLKEDLKQFTAISASFEANANEAASLYIARLQESMRLPNSIMIRVYSGLSKELKRYYDLIRMYYDDEEYAELIQQDGVIVKEDFKEDNAQLMTTADPSQGSEQERVAKANYILDQAKENPQMHNLYDAYNRAYTALGIPDIPNVLPPPSNEPDPMAVMQQKYMEQEMRYKQQDLQLRQSKLRIELMDLQVKAREIESKVRKNNADAAKSESETALNLQEIDLNELATIKDMMETIKTDLLTTQERLSNGGTQEVSTTGAEGLAVTANNQSVSEVS